MKFSPFFLVLGAIGAAGSTPLTFYPRRMAGLSILDVPVRVCPEAYVLDAMTSLVWAFNPHCNRWINGTISADNFNDLPNKEQAKRVESFCQSDCAKAYTEVAEFARPMCFEAGRLVKNPYDGHQLMAALFACTADAVDGSLCFTKYVNSLDAKGVPSCDFYKSCCANTYRTFTRGGPSFDAVEAECPGAGAATSQCGSEQADPSSEGDGSGIIRPTDPMGPTTLPPLNDTVPPLVINVTAPEMR